MSQGYHSPVPDCKCGWFLCLDCFPPCPECDDIGCDNCPIYWSDELE